MKPELNLSDLDSVHDTQLVDLTEYGIVIASTFVLAELHVHAAGI